MSHDGGGADSPLESRGKGHGTTWKSVVRQRGPAGFIANHVRVPVSAL